MGEDNTDWFSQYVSAAAYWVEEHNVHIELNQLVKTQTNLEAHGETTEDLLVNPF